MSDTIHSPKRLLAEAARRSIRELNDNITQETTEQGKCRVSYDTANEFYAQQPGAIDGTRKDRYVAQMENYNRIIGELKERRERWEKALNFALDLLEKP